MIHDIDLTWYNHNTQENIMANNPYQIRYDVLNMAKEIVDKNYDMQLELAYKAMEMHKENTQQAMEAYKQYVPKMMTPEEIKAQADKLYEFVTDKKSD
jgi:hypothetical protein